MAQVPATRSDTLQAAPPRFNCSVTCGAVSQIAATSQTASSTARTVTTGSTAPSRALIRRTGRAAPAPTASVITVTRPQSHPHAVRNLQKLRRLAGIQIAVGRQIAVDHLQDAARTRRHHDDL